ALLVRSVLDQGQVICIVEGCDRTAHIQWDHAQPFSRGGPTSEDNLNPMCGFDNREKEAGRVVCKGGKWVRVTSSGGERSPP
ncbi:MAG: HNH endonuclease, partial [Actinobacteria bacterium]|nr:HNH endonuclease [Actinomycetota bacterium]